MKGAKVAKTGGKTGKGNKGNVGKKVVVGVKKQQAKGKKNKENPMWEVCHGEDERELRL